MKNLYSFLIVLILTLLPVQSAHGDSKTPAPHVTHPVCFNLVCKYQDEKGASPLDCQAAATFTHEVNEDGSEVLGDSSEHADIKLEVQCNQSVLYNGAANRYTDRLGTRIQGLEGPYPAIVLPPDSLVDTHRYTDSSLELADQNLEGVCYVYTGAQ